MVATYSTMLPLGTPLPDFALPDAVSGRTVSAAEGRGERATVVMFLSNHCPYVKHLFRGIALFSQDYADRPVRMLAISSNDTERYPEDNPARMKEVAESQGWRFPYLFDESQSVAKAFRAACTPEFYVFDAAGVLAYRGQFDASRPKNDKPVTGADLRRAVDALLSGEVPAPEQVPSIGCNIKWRPGSEPEYFGAA